MKKVKIKLSLNKHVVSKLNDEQINSIKGGQDSWSTCYYVDVSRYSCARKEADSPR